MKAILSHPTGNANVRAAAEGLVRADKLASFYTTVATFPGSILAQLSVLPPLAELNRRRFDTALQKQTHTWPWLELGRILAGKVGIPNFIQHETGIFCVDAVYRSLDKRVAKTLPQAAQLGTTAVYAYEDGAAFAFRQAKALGLTCLYDLPIGYWRAALRLLLPERERWPEWAATLTGFEDSPTKLAQKDEELHLADKIFVASQFTANTLRDFPGTLAPIKVVPYGFPEAYAARQYADVQPSRRLKLLFVGGLSQRKGIANLFAAVQALQPHVELTLVGRKMTDQCPALDVALRQHRWIPTLPHANVLELMREHDALVFPSLFEGFGLVITEAMSQGTPVITTERTAGPDFITHGQNGWLVEAGSTEALQEAIAELLTRPRSIAEVGRAALETARQRPWEVYGRELALALGE